MARDALREDLGMVDAAQLDANADLSAALIDDSATARAQLFCREEAVLCGAIWFETTMRMLNANVQINWRRSDGDALQDGDMVCEVEGVARAILTAERGAMNLLQTLSGTASIARQFAAAVKGSGARVLDTRKTIPGMRAAQKYAVAVGGGCNHRMGLYDQVLIKENHIAAAGGVGEALRRAQAAMPPDARVQIEVECIGQLKEAVDAGAARVLLDNFSLQTMREAVEFCRAAGGVEVEASGNVELDSVRAVAETGVDFVSVGAMTKHLRAVDFSLRLTL